MSDPNRTPEPLQCCCLNRATGMRCEQRGVPDPQLPDLFVCEAHIKELKCWMIHLAEKDRAKHVNN